MDRNQLFAYIQERQQALRENSKTRKYEWIRGGDNFPDHTLATAFQHFMRDVYSKAREARDKYDFHELGWATPDWKEELQKGIAEHLLKGDPRDVAVYCMFAWFHGWATAAPQASVPNPDTHCQACGARLDPNQNEWLCPACAEEPAPAPYCEGTCGICSCIPSPQAATATPSNG